MSRNKTKEIINGFPKSSSLQWALVGSTILGTLIANERTLSLLIGDELTKTILLVSTLINGVIVALNRTTTTKPLNKL